MYKLAELVNVLLEVWDVCVGSGGTATAETQDFY